METEIDLEKIMKELNTELQWIDFKLHNKDYLFCPFNSNSDIIFTKDFFNIYKFITKYKLMILISKKGINIHNG